MDESVLFDLCLNCGGIVTASPGEQGRTQKVYCSEQCRDAAASRRRIERGRKKVDRDRPPRVTVVIPCEWCGSLTGRPHFCSRACHQKRKDQRKTDRYRADPEYRAHKTKINEGWRRRHGIPVMVRVADFCQVEGCNRKHLAKGFCRSHYYKDRRRRGLVPPEKRVLVEVEGFIDSPCHIAGLGQVTVIPGSEKGDGVIAACPACDADIWMFAERPEHRSCRICFTTVDLDPDDLARLDPTYLLEEVGA